MRVLIAGASSSSGKTLITCGLLASLRERGLRVCAYKTGPDYIDPGHLRLAGKCEAYNLDTWLMSRELTRELFARTSRHSDIALIEGAMGLYDGGMNSCAEIAKLLKAPVILVINAKSLGESAAALALGFREYDKDINLAGVIINNAGSDSHVKIIADSLERVNIKLLGSIRRNDSFTLKERHLGLIPVTEHESFNLSKLRSVIESSLDIQEIVNIAKGAPALDACVSEEPCPVKSVRVAAARDKAFSFYYPESLAVLESLGAELIYFSPLSDKTLPYSDKYIFGGGFPEVFAGELAENESMLESVRTCKRPILAECGGFMYLCRSLRDLEGKRFTMSGIIDSESFMTSRPVIGYLEAKALRCNIMCNSGDIIRGHEFHYSRMTHESSAFEFTRPRTGEKHTGGYANKNILASYLHVNFFGNVKLARKFLTSS